MCFDDFVDSQNVAYSLLKTSLFGKKLSHAYLFDTNNNADAYGFVLSFVKMIVCEHHYSNVLHEECKNCNRCLRIDNLCYPEVKIIEADSLVIKKEQLLELQDNFSRSSLEGTYRIYIIKDCDKMNKQASNSLLKFLEEPVDGIIAILMTNHFSRVLSTIVSRCQVIHLKNDFLFNDNSSLENFAYLYCDSENVIDEFLNNDHNSLVFDTVLSFLLYFEENGLDVLIFMKSMWYNIIQSKEDTLLAFEIMIYFYYDVLKSTVDFQDFIFCNHVNLIDNVSNLNSFDSIIEKIRVIQYGYDMVYSNLNINLLLDDLVIRLGEISGCC